MTSPADDRPLLEDAVDVPLWLETDRDTPLAQRADRDRGIAQRFPAVNDVGRVRAWWAALRPGDALGASLARGRRLVSIALAALGLLAGSGFAAAVLRYDGSTPVNVVRAFALLVGTQSFLLLLTLALLPRGRFGLRALQRSLITLNPAAMAAAVYQRFAKLPESVERLFIWHAGRSSANVFAKWQILLWAQLTAVAFNLGALASAFALIAVTDLAFGWSTTLDLTPHDVVAVTDTISAPWSAWLPQAVPSYSLIEGSRFFRLEHVATPARQADAFTGWWPFLLSSIVMYGLLPRLVLCLVAVQRLHGATRNLLLADGRVTALLDRLRSPSLHLGATAPEHAREPPRGDIARRTARAAGPAAAVIWAESMPQSSAGEATLELLSTELADVPFLAGGRASLTQDRETVERIAAVAPQQVVVFTRAYEPPLLELLDFLVMLRRRLRETVSIIVCPLPETGGHATAEQIDAWRRTVGTLRDSKVYVETIA